MLAVTINLLFTFGILAGLGWIVWRMLKAPRGPVMVCTQCGHHGFTLAKVKGSTGIELILWLCFLIPGLIYSVWRLSSRRPVCTACGSSALVPPSSPVGQRMLGATSSAPDSPQAART
jgi:hypothetical protein